MDNNDSGISEVHFTTTSHEEESKETAWKNIKRDHPGVKEEVLNEIDKVNAQLDQLLIKKRRLMAELKMYLFVRGNPIDSFESSKVSQQYLFIYCFIFRYRYVRIHRQRPGVVQTTTPNPQGGSGHRKSEWGVSHPIVISRYHRGCR